MLNYKIIAKVDKQGHTHIELKTTSIWERWYLKGFGKAQAHKEALRQSFQERSSEFVFDGTAVSMQEVAALLRATVYIPKIGQRIDLA